MTDLQMGLIGLGAAAVVGVLAYNKWQEHKHRKLAETLLSARQADVLLDEPTTVVADDADGMTAGPDPGRFEPLLNPAARPNVVPAARPVPVDDDDEALPASARPARTDEERPVKTINEVTTPLYLLSPTIDYIAAIEVSEPAAAYQIREAQRAALARLGKPVHWIGFNEQEHEWEPILEEADSAYRHIRIGLQLVDRQGPVRDGDLSIFHLAMQDLATELMGFAELPLREPALRIASQLDEFCAGVDIQIGVNVISQGQVFPGTKLRALAESAGMIIDPEGRFARFDDEGRLLYVLINQETQGFSAESMRTLTTHGVTFLLDVPRVANGDRVLIQMVELARRFADALHGALVDDNRRPLSEGSIEPIRRQVVQYQTAMATRQVPAGGALACRLFS
ncbi:cell division protein ZipA C-terminal FtsZ-binding domain-containing protein [Candidatus Accumulibacter vicinus]|uniref:Cell division protein ZipA n=1 Tax=Candidatus Accumulibacter vicinus TaxID=2954382 RepID=A0A084XYB4_9PROT|nr:cell division protein ZipA C-terminal FtsZ-binding domain-containing protein [Candidatus Accumulibacter vicinus]KFB67458.1 MAG: cell division protein ZipA [Candidatus Accumulibacter vicinus]